MRYFMFGLCRLGRRLGAALSLGAAVLVPVGMAQSTAPRAGDDAIAANRQRLVAAYPDVLEGADGDTLVWRDGTRMPFSDGRRDKTPNDRLETPDLDDIFAIPYPLGAPAPPDKDVDPGRARPSQLFDKMYGDCRKGEVERHLVSVPWLPKRSRQRLSVTRVNGVDRKLAAVSAELDALPARFDTYLLPAAGGYACRVIAGTQRMSAHGQGIAVDIALRHAHYWRWSSAAADGAPAWRNAVPLEIVRIFEKHGFIWGGRWYHYDTMHFEYRPEMLPPASGGPTP
jgi:hypothetical protein